MPTFLERLDAWVLDLVEAACRRWQRLTRANQRVARRAAHQREHRRLLRVGRRRIWTNDWGIRGVLAVFAALVLYGLTKSVFRMPIESAESSAYRRVMKGLRNPRRLRDLGIRLPFLGLSVLLAGPSLFAYRWLGIRPFSYGLVLLTTALLYVLACDPLPPQPGAIRERWAALVAALARRPAERPDEA